MRLKISVLVVRSERTLKLGTAVLAILRQTAGRRVGGAGKTSSDGQRPNPMNDGGKP